MKRFKFIYILIVLISTTFTAQSQDRTMVNVVWEQTFGEPSQIEWAASTIDVNGDLITTGHATNGQNGTELLLTKQNENGETVWTDEVGQTSSQSKKFGTAITTTANGDIFAAGVSSQDGLEEHNDYVILKYATNGTAVWNQEFEGLGNGNDIPTAIVSDGLGNVYVTGMSEGNGTELDFFTLKLNGNTGTQIWQKRYDQAGLYDIPVSIDVDNNGNIIVVGASAKTIVQWEMVVLKYSPNGALIGENSIENETLAFEKPSDFAKDAFGNYYITGITTEDGSNFNMKTVKLDSDLNLLWKEEFDGGKVDSTSAAAVDLEGNVYVTGWVSNEQEGTEFMTLKYSSSGELLWRKKRTSREINARAKSNGIAIDEDGNVIIVGEVDFGERSEAIVCQYDSEGQTRWEKKLSHQEFQKNRPSKVLINDEGDIYVTGISKNENEKTYTSAKLERKRRDLTPVLSSNEEPLYVRDEVIIRVKPEYLNMNFVDNVGLSFGKVSEIISSSQAISEIDNALEAGGDFENWCLIKVHRRLTSQTASVISRTGQTLAVPDFWATFILVIPRRHHLYGETREIAAILDGDNLRKYLRYAEFNLFTSPDNCPPDNEPIWMWQGSGMNGMRNLCESLQASLLWSGGND